MIRALQIAVLGILDRADGYEWSVQGMGMLRLYIQKVGRLHIWDSRLRYPGVSMIHNHSWDLRSTIVSGTLLNTRYEIFPAGPPTHFRRRLLTGYHCEFVASREQLCLIEAGPRERYYPGDCYHQRADVVHMTDAVDGCVTLMERREDVDGHADVFWKIGEEWGNARPRPATLDEVHMVTNHARQMLEDSL